MLPRPGTTKGVPGTELFGEEWAHQLVSQCLLPLDVSLALEAPLRTPLSASIGRRTTVIPGMAMMTTGKRHSSHFPDADVLTPIAKVLLNKHILYTDFLCVLATSMLRWYGLHK
jgi:hypothetical protein